MSTSVHERLEIARKNAGYASLGEAAEALQVPYPTYAAHENGVRGIGRNAERYARFYGVSLDWLMRGIGPGPTRHPIDDDVRLPTRYVPLKGHVGAGQAVYAIDDGGDAEVEAPPNVPEETVAVEVRGDSMFPVFEDGTLLYYSRLLPPAEMLNNRCVVHLADGRILVKTLKRGADATVFTLSSFNAPDMEDMVVEWASPIDWIKPRRV